MTKATLICDAQFGSTGKGLLAGYIAERDKPDTVVTAWAANAGHTYINGEGRKFVHTMLANGVVSPGLKRIMIGPGSLININNLIREVEECADIFESIEHQFEGIFIHEHAAVIESKHREKESETMLGIGSTSKGVGAALSDKIARQVGSTAVLGSNAQMRMLESFNDRSDLPDIFKVVNQSEYISKFNRSESILIEGAQGYSLGINSGFYPFVTSRECTPRQIMVDCGLPGWINPTIIASMRTYPIRVANRYDSDGKMVGYSGPGYPDQEETTFEEIGQEPELTTVTQLPRRIFNWSHDQLVESLNMIHPDEIFLNFANYMEDHDVEMLIHDINAVNQYEYVRYVGRGPLVTDVEEI